MCEVPGHLGPEVSKVWGSESSGVISHTLILCWTRCGKELSSACLYVISRQGVLRPRITSRTYQVTGAGRFSGYRKRYVSIKVSSNFFLFFSWLDSRCFGKNPAGQNHLRCSFCIKTENTLSQTFPIMIRVTSFDLKAGIVTIFYGHLVEHSYCFYYLYLTFSQQFHYFSAQPAKNISHICCR